MMRVLVIYEDVVVFPFFLFCCFFFFHLMRTLGLDLEIR